MTKLDEKEITESILKKVTAGASDLKIYRALKVSPQTFNFWKNDHQEEYDQAKTESQLSALEKVEAKLNKKVRGGWRRKERYEVNEDGKEILVSVERQQVDPELNAIMFWLKAHNPEIYDKVTLKRLELEEKSTAGVQDIIQGLTQFDVKNYSSDEPEVTEDEINALLDEEETE